MSNIGLLYDMNKIWNWHAWSIIEYKVPVREKYSYKLLLIRLNCNLNP